jgi:glycosyltransferase involved in cell wall biosynthesis
MKISVIIPTLNEEKYIENALFHIKKQKPYEIIVADSYSEDNTVRVARRYGTTIIRAIKKNAAVGRNAGARKAMGEILVFMDADTIAFPNLLETIEKDFRRDKRLVCWTCKVYAFSPLWKEHLLYDGFNGFVQSSAKMKKPKAAGVIMAVRKKAFNIVGGFDENINFCEDFDLCSRIKELGNFKFSTKTCVYTSTRRIDRLGFWGSIKKYVRMYLKKTVNNDKICYRPVR